MVVKRIIVLTLLILMNSCTIQEKFYLKNSRKIIVGLDFESDKKIDFHKYNKLGFFRSDSIFKSNNVYYARFDPGTHKLGLLNFTTKSIFPDFKVISFISDQDTILLNQDLFVKQLKVIGKRTCITFQDN